MKNQKPEAADPFQKPEPKVSNPASSGPQGGSEPQRQDGQKRYREWSVTIREVSPGMGCIVSDGPSNQLISPVEEICQLREVFRNMCLATLDRATEQSPRPPLVTQRSIREAEARKRFGRVDPQDYQPGYEQWLLDVRAGRV